MLWSFRVGAAGREIRSVEVGLSREEEERTVGRRRRNIVKEGLYIVEKPSESSKRCEQGGLRDKDVF